MGQEILYCNKCGTKLHGDDFTRGRAHTIDNRQFCQKCVSINLKAGQRPAPAETPAPARSRSKMPAATPRPMPAVAPTPKSPTALYVGVGIAVVALAAVLVFVLASPAPPPPPPASPPAPATVAAPKPDPAQATRQKEKMAQELKDLEPKIAPMIQGEQFVAATAFLEEARKRYDAPEWTAPLTKRLQEVQEIPAGLFPAARDQAVAAQSRGATADVQQIRGRIASWGRKELLEDLDGAVKAIVPREPLPAGVRVLMRWPDSEGKRYRLAAEQKGETLHGLRHPENSSVGFESGLEILRIPTEGEVRVTYSTNTLKQMEVVLRGTVSDGKNYPFHFFVEPTEAGRPVTAKMSTSKLVDWNNKLIEKNAVINNIYVLQNGKDIDLRVYEFVVFATKE